MTRTGRLTALIASILFISNVQLAPAQTHVFVPIVDALCGDVCNGQLLQIDLDAGVIVRDVPFTNTRGSMGRAVVTPDDYVVVPWTNEAQTASYPVVIAPWSGATFPLTQFSTGAFRQLVSDPSRTRLYQSVDPSSGSLRVIDPSGTVTWTICPNIRDFALTGDATRLVVSCRGEVVVVETTGGAIVRRFPVSDDYGSLAVTSDGSRVFLGGSARVTAFDVASGAAGLEWRPAFVTNFATIFAFDRVSGRLFIQVGNFPSSIVFHAVNTATMTSAGTVPMPPQSSNATDIAIDPHRARAVMITTSSPRSIAFPTISVVDTASLTLTASARLEPGLAARHVSLVLQPAPSSPINLRATRDGRNAVFTWELRPGSPAASDFIIEAGSVSGSANLATVRTGGPWPAFEVRSIPPGRYFLRVRTVINGRIGLPSNEIELVVP